MASFNAYDYNVCLAPRSGVDAGSTRTYRNAANAPMSLPLPSMKRRNAYVPGTEEEAEEEEDDDEGYNEEEDEEECE